METIKKNIISIAFVGTIITFVTICITLANYFLYA